MNQPDDYTYPVTADSYDITGEIGSGAFATVYKAIVRQTGEEVAIKLIDLDQFNASWDEIRREISTMSLLQHPNVVRIKCSFVDASDLYIVMQLFSCGSCASLIKNEKLNAKNGFKDEVLVATILKEVLNGMVYFHSNSRIHRDIKAGNILIGEDGSVVIADFGVASTLMENGDRKRNRQTFTGTPCWMAPEVMEQTIGYDEKADIWSFGITALELAYGRAPYSKYAPMKVMLLTLQEDPPTAEIYGDNSYSFSKHFHSLVAKCLRKEPSKRPSAKKLLEHKFFKSARNSIYIIENIVRHVIPPPEQKTQTPLQSALSLKQRKEKGVKVGSWIFDMDELSDSAKEDFAKRRASLTNSKVPEESDDSDYENEEKTSIYAAASTAIHSASSPISLQQPSSPGDSDILAAFDPFQSSSIPHLQSNEKGRFTVKDLDSNSNSLVNSPVHHTKLSLSKPVTIPSLNASSPLHTQADATPLLSQSALASGPLSPDQTHMGSLKVQHSAHLIVNSVIESPPRRTGAPIAQPVALNPTSPKLSPKSVRKSGNPIELLDEVTRDFELTKTRKSSQPALSSSLSSPTRQLQPQIREQLDLLSTPIPISSFNNDSNSNSNSLSHNSSHSNENSLSLNQPPLNSSPKLGSAAAAYAALLAQTQSNDNSVNDNTKLQ